MLCVVQFCSKLCNELSSLERLLPVIGELVGEVRWGAFCQPVNQDRERQSVDNNWKMSQYGQKAKMIFVTGEDGNFS